LGLYFTCTCQLLFSFLFKARCQNNIATILEKQGRRKQALKIMKSTLPVLHECLPPTHPDIATLHINIATIYDTIGDYSNAINNYQSCLQIQNASLPSHHPDLARTKLYMKWSTAHIQHHEELAKHVRKMLNFARFLLRSNYLKHIKRNEAYY
jgi:tetratricopeptide (TPR) repeat protein